MSKTLTREQMDRRNELQRERRVADPARTRAHERAYRERHPDRVKAINARIRERLGPEYWRLRQQALKAEMVARMGGRCACCGETELAFLSLDHVNGGGAQERRAQGGQMRIIRALRDAGWPTEGYRILCMNCQFGFLHGRTCPHQLVRLGVA